LFAKTRDDKTAWLLVAVKAFTDPVIKQLVQEKWAVALYLATHEGRGPEAPPARASLDKRIEETSNARLHKYESFGM
jgi:hypothetical protein